jgi:hypothetical protein
VLALIALSILWAAAPASDQTATDVTTCQGLITQVQVSTCEASFVNAEHLAGLLGKLDTATIKLDEGKPENILQALIQFRDKVSTVVAQGKLGPVSGELLMNGDIDTAGVNDAISCVDALINV